MTKGYVDGALVFEKSDMLYRYEETWLVERCGTCRIGLCHKKVFYYLCLAAALAYHFLTVTSLGLDCFETSQVSACAML